MNTQLQMSELSQQDLADVVKRAQEIDAAQVASSGDHQDLESFLLAAEEVGIRREAILQALAEKGGQPLAGAAPGDKVFARSSDGNYYVATIKEMRGGIAVVRFLSGSDHSLPTTDLRSFSILPGQKIQANWPSWGWWSVTVEEYDPEKGKVTCNDGWSSKTFPLTEVRLKEEPTRRERTIRSLLFRVGVICGGLGAVAGALLMRFFA